MKQMKRILVMCLCLVMYLSVFPPRSFAEAEEDGGILPQPGQYFYTARAEGFENDEGAVLTIGTSEKAPTATMDMEEDTSVLSVQAANEDSTAPSVPLPAPTNLTWGKDLYGNDYPGMIGFSPIDQVERLYEVRIYREGEEGVVKSGRYWYDPGYTDQEWMTAFSFITEEMPSGTYYFTVQAKATNEEPNYTDSDISVSESWQYTAPAAKLGTPANITISSSGEFSATLPDDLSNCDGYLINLYYMNEQDHSWQYLSMFCYTQLQDVSYLEEDITNQIRAMINRAHRETIPGTYGVYIRLLSRDITTIRPSDWSNFAQFAYTGYMAWSIDSAGVLTISGSGPMENYGSINNVTMAPWGSGIRSVVIEEGITSIGNSAFSGCSELTNITIPENVTSIGLFAFSGCSGLTSITIPSKVVSIGFNALLDCSNLMDITLPPVGQFSNIIGSSMYGGSGNVHSVHLIKGDQASVIPQGYFMNTSYPVDTLTIEEGITSIGNSAFSGCSELTSITIPDSVTSIGNSAFSGCTNLTSITIPESVTRIGSNAFENCSGLTSITIPSKVLIIGENALLRCSNLMEITLPPVGQFSSIIGSTMYGNSGNVHSVHLIKGDQASVIPERYFINNSYPADNVTIEEGITSIGNTAFENCSGLTRITIPESVTNIGVGVFNRCSGLKSITIPESVTSIGSFAFSDCSGLTSITIPSKVVIIEDGTFAGCSGLKSITIPESVTSIGSSAFSGCSELTSITIPTKVVSIGENALSGCSNLMEITLPPVGQFRNIIGSTSNTMNGNSGNVHGVHLIKGDQANVIPEGYFMNTSYPVDNITIEEGITSIGNYAFPGCTSLTSITIPDSMTSIGDNAFIGCTSLTDVHYRGTEEQWASITIGNGNESITSATIHYNWREGGTLVLPAGLTTIGSEAFVDLPGVSTVFIPASVTDIADDSFDPGITIKAPAGSYAITWAINHDFEYIED